MFGFFVAYFDDQPTAEYSKFAKLHTGRCKKCKADLDKAEKDELTKGVAKFSLENQMDILMGYDNPRNTHFPGHDVGAILTELGYYFKHATILESQLIALNHMQVDVCFLRGSSVLSQFRKILSPFLKTFWNFDNFNLS